MAVIRDVDQPARRVRGSARRLRAVPAVLCLVLPMYACCGTGVVQARVQARVQAAAQAAELAAADGPRFLDRSALDIPLRRLTAEPTAAWTVEVVNPSGRPIDVRLRVTGPIAGAIQVSGPASLRVQPSQSGTFRLTRGTKPSAGKGELVVVSAAGLDRRPVVITQQAHGLWAWLKRHWRMAVGGALLLLIVPPVIVRMGRGRWARRRRNVPTVLPAAANAGAPAGGGATLGGEGWHNDESAVDDKLDRGQYVAALAKLALTVEPPMVIGLFGEWGSGKTTLLRHIHAKLAAETNDSALVWFDAWKHQFDENPVLPLLHAIVRDLRLEGHGEVHRALWVISEALSSIALTATTRLTMGDVRKSIDDYDKANFRLRSTRTRIDEHFAELVTKALRARGARRLVIFIDDLDRCLPDQIIALLEALKLYLNRRECVFLLAVDNERLVKVIAGKYGELGIEGPDYLEKIVQMPFSLPRLSAPVFERYVDHLLHDEVEPAAPLLQLALKRNPRTIKRFVNVLVLHDAIARVRGVAPYDVRVLAIILLLRADFPDFYRTLEADPTLLGQVADDIEAAAHGVAVEREWPSEIAALVERSLRIAGVPRDVTDYLDLATVSPPPEDSHVPTDLDETIALRRGMVAAATDDPTRRAQLPDLQSDLAEALRDRFRRTGARADLDEAIAFAREAVRVTPTDRSDHARRLAGLGDALRARYELTGDANDLDEAIEVRRQATEATPPTHSDYATRLAGLAMAYRARFGATQQKADLDAAVELGRRAASAARADHPDRPAIVSDLCRALETRFELTGAHKDRDEAALLRRGADSTEP